MTTTISTAGTTTISLSEWSTLIVSTTGAGSIEFASGAEKLKSSSTAKLTNTTYGPFGVPTTATVTLTTGSFTYDLGGIHNVTAQTDEATGGISLVAGGGEAVPFGRAAIQPRRNRVIKQFSDLLGVTISTSNATVVSTIDPNSPFGCPALKLVCTFSTTGGRVEVTPPATNIPTFNGQVAYSIWVDDVTRVGTVGVFIGDAGFAKYQQANMLLFSAGELVGGHRVVFGGPIRKDNVTDGAFVFGTDSFQATKLRITAANPLGGTATVWVRDCFIPAPQKPIVCFTWDDGFDTWVTKVVPMLSSSSIKATFAINTDQIDKGATGITSANVQALIAAGHHIAGHNIYNYKLQTLFSHGNGESNGASTSQSVATYMADYHTSRAALEAIGVDPDGLMYHPYVQGGCDQAVVESMSWAGVDLARTASPYEAQMYGVDLGNNALALRTVNLSSSRTLAQAKAKIDEAVAYGGLCIFMGHQTHDTTADSTTWLTADLQALIEYSATSGAEHLTMMELRDRLVQIGALKNRASSMSTMPVRCIGRLLLANMNSTADQAITLDPGQWKIEGVYATKATLSLTTAAGGVYTGAAKGGTAIVAAGQVYSGLVAQTDVIYATMAATPTVTGSIYLSLTVAQGAAATTSIYVFGRPI